jgi:hypothetical protein
MMTNGSPGPVQLSATLDLRQDGAGVLTGTFIVPDLQAAICLGPNLSLSMAGYVDGTNMSVSGSNDLEQISASIQAAVDPPVSK